MTSSAERVSAGAMRRRIAGEPITLLALATLVVAVAVALCGPLLADADPNATDLSSRLLRPLSEGHLLGTDQLGRDLGVRLIFGLRLSLAVAVSGVAVAAALGTLIGVVAAYFGRTVDVLSMRLVDVLMAFPYLLLALAIVAALGPGLFNATLAIAVVNVPFFARTVRGAALAVMAEDFVLAARALGGSSARVLFAHVLPSLASPLVVAASASVGWMLLETAGLSFLGLGAQPPTADLGGMLGQGRHLAATAPHVTLVPGLTIFLVAMSVNVLGDSLRDALDVVRPQLGSDVEQRAGRADAAPEARDARPAASEASARGSSRALLEVESLSVRFPSVPAGLPAVSSVSFSVWPGERVAVVGPSGSGKSLTALAVLDLLPAAAAASSDGLRYAGVELRKLPPEERRGLLGSEIALVPQDPQTSLHPLYRVGDQIVEAILRHQAVSRADARLRARSLLEELRVADAEARLDAFPHELSGGMRQRVAIAIALSNEPALIIADEPTTALDVTTQAAVLDVLHELTARRGTAILYITHDLGVVAEVCSRVLVMHQGCIVESATTEELFRAPRHQQTRALLAAARGSDLRRPGALTLPA